MIAATARTLAAAAAYGYCLGSAHSELYAVRNLVKFPVLLLVTGAVCAVGHFVVARTATTRLGFREVQGSVGRLFHDTSLLLASLGPVILFVGRSLRATDDGRLGSYDLFLTLNVVAIAVAGTLALLRQGRDLLGKASVTTRTARGLVLAWLALTLAVGGQAAFYMRPFFGVPATRGGDPPWFLGATPDIRGATNFYEMVWQAVRRPELRGREAR